MADPPVEISVSGLIGKLTAAHPPIHHSCPLPLFLLLELVSLPSPLSLDSPSQALLTCLLAAQFHAPCTGAVQAQALSATWQGHSLPLQSLSSPLEKWWQSEEAAPGDPEPPPGGSQTISGLCQVASSIGPGWEQRQAGHGAMGVGGTSRSQPTVVSRQPTSQAGTL